MLKVLKNFAEEGKATFVFAGYWTRYQYIVADYLSPLYNFGELIVLEGLKVNASVVQKSLERWGIKRDEGVFSFCVPLMKENVLKTNAKGRKALLGELVEKFSR